MVRQIDQLSTLSCTFLLTIQPNYVYLQKKRKRKGKMDDYQMHPITIDSIKSLCNCDYLDNDLVIFDEIAKVPIPDEPRRMGCILMALCLNGTATYNVDTKAHHVKAGDVIIISTNQVTDSFNMSADCSGMA